MGEIETSDFLNRKMDEARRRKKQVENGTFDIRKAMRAQQNNYFEKKLSQEPHGDQGNERDVQAISDAENTMANYDMKSSNDYKLPKDEQTISNNKNRENYTAAGGFVYYEIKRTDLKDLFTAQCKNRGTLGAFSVPW